MTNIAETAVKAARTSRNRKTGTDPSKAEKAAEKVLGRLARALEKAANASRKERAKADERRAKIRAAEGRILSLPAIVTRGGAQSVDLAFAARFLFTTVNAGGAITVDVETSGYPLGHRHYELRTIQVGTGAYAVVLDAADPQQCSVASMVLRQAKMLHAHNATADLAPLAYAGLIDYREAWSRMVDTAVLAKLANPRLTGGDPGLKVLAPTVLGDESVVGQADTARKNLFRVAGWLTNTETDTDPTRSGWYMVNKRCETMVVYAGSDVLDTGALAVKLPWPEPNVLARERAFQAVMARVAFEGVRVDLDWTRYQISLQEPKVAEAARILRDNYGVENPGSPKQLKEAFQALGAKLPIGKTGTPTTDKDALKKLAATAEGPVKSMAEAVLEWRKAEKLLQMLRSYEDACINGDGFVRPTIYTLGADTGRTSCVQSDALIEMPRDLTKYPHGVPITEVKAGDLVYAFDHHRELVLRRVKWCEQTGVRQTMVITAENRDGRRITLRATPDHLIRLYNGDWRATENLMHQIGRPHREDGPRIMTMVRRFVDGGYAKFYPHANAAGNGPNGGGRSREHRWVLGQVRGKAVSTKWDVHHLDGNKLNNHPSNLVAMRREEHRGNRDLAWGTEQPTVELPSGSNDFRVISVTPGPVEPVWDMEVEEVHNFIANGICVHNCVRPNLQQVPKTANDGERGVRQCFRSKDDDWVLLACDFSQVEVRVGAALSQDQSFIRMINEGLNLHNEIADMVFGPGQWNAKQKTQIKAMNFCKMFGGGARTMAKQAGCSVELAEQVSKKFDQYAPAFAAWARNLVHGVEMGRTQFQTYSGRVIHLDPDAPHKAMNYPIQGTARELAVDASLAFAASEYGYGWQLIVHDELLVTVRREHAEAAKARLLEVMTRDFMGVPITAEADPPSTHWPVPEA